jgi:hypothetical protein
MSDEADLKRAIAPSFIDHTPPPGGLRGGLDGSAGAVWKLLLRF